MEVVIGISGASGVGYGIRLLQVMEKEGLKTHLIMTEAARQILEIETDMTASEVEAMATHSYDPGDFKAPVASGSYLFDSMVVAPCSMRTLAGVAGGVSDSLITRVADVSLKERRKLVMVTRESPLNLIHLRNMVAVTEAGGLILPACPPFYPKPESIDELIDVVVGRVLDVLGVSHKLYRRWGGQQSERKLLL